MAKAVRKLGIRDTIAAVFVVLWVFFLSILFLSNHYVNRLVKGAELFTVSSAMVEHCLEIRRHEKNFILRGDARYSDLVYTFIGKIMTSAEEYKRIGTATERKDAVAVLESVAEYRHAFERLAQKRVEGSKPRENEEIVKTGRALQQKCEALKNDILESLSQSRKRIAGVRFVAALLFIVAGLATFLIISLKVFSPLQKLQQLSRDMGKDGVLNQGQIHRMDRVIKQISSHDEIGELARAYRMMVVRYYNSYLGLQDKMKEVEELSKIKVEFASMVSHELRTPLTAIKEVVDLLFYEISGKLDKDQKEFLKVAKRNIDRLTRLINDILDFSKLSSRKLAMKIENVSLNEVIESVVHIHRVAIERRDLHLVTHIRGTRHILVRADQDRVNQVLTNLFNNAIKFTHKGSIVVSTSLEEQGSLIKVSVKDTGAGIAAEDMQRLFQPFTQLDDARNNKKKKEGTGLGLAICKLIIEQLGGTITVESTVGEGSIFSFTLPVSGEIPVSDENV